MATDILRHLLDRGVASLRFFPQCFKDDLVQISKKNSTSPAAGTMASFFECFLQRCLKGFEVTYAASARQQI